MLVESANRLGEILFTKISGAFSGVKGQKAVYGRKVAMAAIGSLVVGVLIRFVVGPGWANFLGAVFVAVGGFLLAVSEDRSKKDVGVLGMACVTFGGVLIATDAFPGWPAP